MYISYQNLNPKYRQETYYNYVKNSDFGAPDCFFLCSPLLHYHYVSTSLTMQIPAETLSQTHRVCFMLLCYRFVSTTLTAQIPVETLSQSHRLCFIGKERDSETGFSYFGARYYDSDLMTGWLSVDPMADKDPGLSPYNYCALNPIRIIDPNGDSCAVLLAGNRLKGLGHMGILVQRKNDKGQMRWFLYSKNGDDGAEGLKEGPGGVKGTSDDEGYGGENGEGFLSVQSFLDDEKENTLKHDGSGGVYYTDAYVIPTTESQDDNIVDIMTSELNNKYNLILSNCSQAVRKSLKNSGVRVYPLNMEYLTSENILLDKVIPRSAFDCIIKSNKNGLHLIPNSQKTSNNG